MNTFFTPYLEAAEMKDVWDNIETKYKKILILKTGLLNITPQEQFEHYFEGRKLIFTNIKKAKIQFLIIFYGNDSIFLLNKIEKIVEHMDMLSKLDNWIDTTGSTTFDIALNTSENIDNNDIVSKTGSSDNNSLGEGVYLQKSLAIDSGIDILANQLGQIRSNEKSVITNNELNTNKIVNNNTSENKARIMLRYINLSINNLLGSFWNQFNELFFA